MTHGPNRHRLQNFLQSMSVGPFVQLPRLCRPAEHVHVVQGPNRGQAKAAMNTRVGTEQAPTGSFRCMSSCVATMSTAAQRLHDAFTHESDDQTPAGASSQLERSSCAFIAWAWTIELPQMALPVIYPRDCCGYNHRKKHYTRSNSM